MAFAWAMYILPSRWLSNDATAILGRNSGCFGKRTGLQPFRV